MSPLVVGSALGAAALTVGRGAAAAMGNGLSFAGELLRVSGGAAAPKPEDGQAATQRARTELHGRIAELTEQIRRRLAAAGINLLRPVELMTNGLGGIAVAGAHPQQAAIEETLGRDVLLERDFNRLASDYGQFVAQHGAADLPPTLTVVVPAA
jgi:hypothetical protein